MQIGPEYFINRELSWLAFNERVLEEAIDKTNPLMERLKFLAITASNLDEFFMVRVSSLWETDFTVPDPSGLTSPEQLREISKSAHEMTERQYNFFTRSLLPAMARENIVFLEYAQLNDSQREHADNYFKNEIYQVITPMAVDQSRPFPVLNNRTINICIELAETGRNDEDEPLYAVMQVPTVLPRIISLPAGPGQHRYIFLEKIILAHIDVLFPGYSVSSTAFIRVTRNSDLVIDEEEVENLLDGMARSIRNRRWGDPVRLEVSKGINPRVMHFFQKALDLETDEIYEINGPLDLTVWMGFSSLPEFSRLCNRRLSPRPSVDFMRGATLFEVIRERDVLVHHPYMSFDSVLRFIQEAAADPQVLAIKQTLYRVSGQSPVINALMQAAENGKQVTVLLELRARFDEENNIIWARTLDKAGVHVVYGLMGLKTHCKVCLVVRREEDGIRRYVHLGTGNYNETTAKIYTDTGLFTCRESFGQDSSMLFNVLTGYSKMTDWQKFAVAPVTLRKTFLRLIETEIRHAGEGRPAEITAKMNALSDTEIIQALYRASIAGVKIRLLVRGICCLRVGIPGVSENISVSSIVDRYLEHSRIFYFHNGGYSRVYLSSADWMPRNLDRRVEVLFPVESEDLKDELLEMLELSFSDNVKRRELHPDGSYKKPNRRGRPPVQSQLELYKKVADTYKTARENIRKSVFT